MGIMNFFKGKGRRGDDVTEQRNIAEQPKDTSPRVVSEAVQNSEGIWEQEYEVWKGDRWEREVYQHNGTEWVKAKIDLSKRIPDTERGISLKKSIISLDKTLINLSKDKGISLEKHRAKVAVVMDYSYSMEMLYSGGAVQDVLTRIMPLALRFDDDGELDVWLFTSKSKRVEPMDLNNFETYVKKVVKKSGFSMGSTYYAPVLGDVLDKYFIEEKETSEIPTFVIFITDGENMDEGKTDKVVRESAEKNIFIQFVGIGDEEFKYLSKLDDLTGRPIDNTGFIKVSDMAGLSDDELYNMLLDQYPEWLRDK